MDAEGKDSSLAEKCSDDQRIGDDALNSGQSENFCACKWSVGDAAKSAGKGTEVSGSSFFMADLFYGQRGKETSTGNDFAAGLNHAAE